MSGRGKGGGGGGGEGVGIRDLCNSEYSTNNTYCYNSNQSKGLENRRLSKL